MVLDDASSILVIRPILNYSLSVLLYNRILRSCRYIRSTLNIFLVLILVFQLSGCGFVQNISKLARSSSSTYSFGEPYVHRGDPENTKILLRIVDIGCFKDKEVSNLRNSIYDAFVNVGYNMVKLVSEADLVITITFKNFSIISEGTVRSLEKYIRYKEASGIVKASDSGVVGNDVNLAVSDEGVGFSSLKNNTPMGRSTSFFKSLFERDFTSGAALGALGAFLIASGNPLTLFIGAATGAVISAVLQVISQTKSYSGSIGVRISKRVQPYTIKRKSLSFDSSNVAIEAFVEENSNWVDYNSDFLVIVNSPLTSGRARKVFAKESIKSLSSLLVH